MKRSWIGILLVIAFALGSAPSMIGLAAADEVECPEGDGWLECKARAGDRMAIYRLGRTAYEEARESGDFAEALHLSRQLVGMDDKNGERLLKMVHMQLGWGAHKDFVQAYVWLSEDLASGDDYLDKWIKTLEEKMTPEQLEQARALAGN